MQHQPGRHVAVKRVDWSTDEQRSSVAKVHAPCNNKCRSSSLIVGRARLWQQLCQQLIRQRTNTQAQHVHQLLLFRRCSLDAISVYLHGIQLCLLPTHYSHHTATASCCCKHWALMSWCLHCLCLCLLVSCLMQRIATEITVLQSLQHPLLPKLHQVYTTGDEICLEMTVS